MPLQELLKDNDEALKREEMPSGIIENQKKPSLENEEGFPGVNLEDASLEDLKRLRKLVNKKIKAASKKKPETSPNQGETTITYEKLQTTSQKASNADNTQERKPKVDNGSQGVRSLQRDKVNDEEWVTVKRKNWNKFKGLAEGGPSPQSQQQPNRGQQPKKGQQPTVNQNQPKKGGRSYPNQQRNGPNPQQNQVPRNENLKKSSYPGNRKVFTQPGFSRPHTTQWSQNPQVAAPMWNPAYQSPPQYLLQPGMGTILPGPFHSVGGTFQGGQPQQRVYLGY